MYRESQKAKISARRVNCSRIKLKWNYSRSEMSQGVRGTLGRDRDGGRRGALFREKLQRNNISWSRLAGKTVILFLRPQFRGDIINLLLALPSVKLASM